LAIGKVGVSEVRDDLFGSDVFHGASFYW
jgi:hypothetical protein